MIKTSITTVTPSSVNQAVGTVVMAFSADPAARWFYPDPHQYLLHLPNFVRAFAGKAFEHNSAYYVDGYLGAALWLPPDVHPDEDALVALLQRTIAEENQQNVFAFLERMDSYHPSEPHWYLPMIGVDPAHQHQGYGSALLQHALLACDRDHQLAYLESSSQRVCRFMNGTASSYSARFRLGSRRQSFRCYGNHGDSYSLRAITLRRSR